MSEVVIVNRVFKNQIHAFIDGKAVEMGEGGPDIYFDECRIHGKQVHFIGYNQGGHDCVKVCSKCVEEVAKAFTEKETYIPTVHSWEELTQLVEDRGYTL